MPLLSADLGFSFSSFNVKRAKRKKILHLAMYFRFKMTAFKLFCTEHPVDVLALADSGADYLPSMNFFALITRTESQKRFWKL